MGGLGGLIVGDESRHWCPTCGEVWTPYPLCGPCYIEGERLQIVVWSQVLALLDADSYDGGSSD